MKNKNFLRIFAFIALSSSLSSYGNSPYITRVYEYSPAPGQFINTTPEISADDTKETINSKVLEQIGNDRTPGLISLGAFGGYVIFGFDHPVVNVLGEYDFKIYGNAVFSNSDKTGGSCEPGIVLVSVDANKNGLPDDPWYELAGSEYNKESTKKNYKVTYYRTSPNHEATPNPNVPMVTDTTYIKWTDSEGSSGYLTKNTFHTQSYWPEWQSEDKLEFQGTRLANNSVDVSGNASYYVLMKMDWGYVDNYPNNDVDFKGFDISWAVDENGNNVTLSSIDFIKVHTGILACNGWIGENSTEIAGAEDLHPNATNGIATITSDRKGEGKKYDIFGREIKNIKKGDFYIQNGKKYIAR